jgi:uncharacterized protein YkwD
MIMKAGKFLLTFLMWMPGWMSVADGPDKAGGRWDAGAMNTAAHVTYLSETEKEVILEINKLRSDPGAYARHYLEPLLPLYKGKLLHYPGDVPIVTREGAAAVREAIKALKEVSPVPLLSPDIRLTKAARDHQRDQSAGGRTGHTGSDGSTAQERIKRYGEWNISMGENIFYGDPDARSVVLHLVIDDGIPGRGHRKNFLNSSFHLAGVAVGPHPGWRNVCVIDFANSFRDVKTE